ncbi:MAG: bifunctional glutamate N-acetyltransferase/amino-acid acetyltransferase ArgJ [Blastocatellia bacterium]
MPSEKRRTPSDSITAPRGFVAASVRCGLKKNGDDLAIIYSEVPAVAAAVFTQNLVQAAPVVLSREHLRHKTHRAFIVNAGCANACTGEAGMKDAQRTTQLLAGLLNCDPREILVASTGVIGVRLKMEKLEAGISAAASQLSRAGGAGVAEAIMTTDTRPKRAVKRLKIGGKSVTIAGAAKGSGMIHPKMATMLSFVTTDAAISKTALQAALKRAVEASFNCISVDGDTSTNDTLAVLANGAAQNEPIKESKGEAFEQFTRALTDVCRALAIAVARDGEGARKLITVRVLKAPTARDAKRIAETIATSPLVKTAIAGEDANWGRLMMAAGRSGAKFDVSKVEIRIGNLPVCRQGGGLKFDEQRALEILKRDEVTLTINLHQGEAEMTAWTCDLTEGYIRINADYRS